MTDDKVSTGNRLPISAPVISHAAMTAALHVLASPWIGYGPRCQELEARFRRNPNDWALATVNCTAALWIVAQLLRRRPTDEVIIPAITFAGCAAAFSRAGWRVRLADVDAETGLLDLHDVRHRVSSHTQVLLAVDTFGQRVDMAGARQLCDESRLWLVRDAAHRLDVDDSDNDAADFTCYSFGPTKELSCPDGGLLYSTHKRFEAEARALSWWGASRDTWQRVQTSSHQRVTYAPPFGLKLRSNDVTAAIAQAHMDLYLEHRKTRAALYDGYRRALRSTSVRMPLRRADTDSFLMAYCVCAVGKRPGLRSALAAHGVASSDHYPSLTSVLGPSRRDACPAADRFGDTVLTLPMHVPLELRDIVRVCEILGEAL